MGIVGWAEIERSYIGLLKLEYFAARASDRSARVLAKYSEGGGGVSADEMLS